MDSYEGILVTKCALRLAPLVFVRPGELRKATWDEVNFDKAEWRIPAERMKMREQHIVPLSRQAIEILRELEPLTGKGIPAKPDAPRYIFPGAQSRKRPMSENAILAALRRMGYPKEEMSGHGFRSMACWRAQPLNPVPPPCHTARNGSAPCGFRYPYSAVTHPHTAGRQKPPDSSARC